MNEDGTRQAVAGFSLVQLLPGLAPQFRILNPVERYVEYDEQEETMNLSSPLPQFLWGTGNEPRVG